SDDGVRVWVNDSIIINHWTVHSSGVGDGYDSVKLNLVGLQFYTVKIEYFQHDGGTKMQLSWRFPGQAMQPVAQGFLYPPSSADSYNLGALTIEKRVNSFRKPNHI